MTKPDPMRFDALVNEIRLITPELATLHDHWQHFLAIILHDSDGVVRRQLAARTNGQDYQTQN